MIQYILECMAFQLVFLVIYDLWLKGETFFQWNRLYLIATYVLSLVLPWVKIEAFRTAVPEKYAVYPEFLWQLDQTTAGVTASGGSFFQLSWQQGLLIVGMSAAALSFGYKLYQIHRLRTKGQVHYFADFTRVVIKNSNLAFSFFKSIFLGDRVLENEHQNIIAHEMVHIRQRHSYDLLFFELMRIVGWFNPLVYVYQARVSELHEFIADAQVAKTDKKGQYQMLLSQVFQTQQISFINQFFKSSLIKKRIVMLQKSKSKKVLQLKYLLLLPVLVGMLFYSSCQNEGSTVPVDTITVGNIEQLTVAEEQQVFDRLTALSEGTGDWQLFVKDKNSTMKFIPSGNGSYITGPNNEKIPARLAIDSKLEAYEDMSGSKGHYVDADKYLTAKYAELSRDRERLLKAGKSEGLELSRLDAQLKELREQILRNNGGVVAFAWVDEAPVFPGCENETDKRACFNEKMQRHVSKNFRYPQEAQEKGIQGRVNVMFIIGDDGAIHNIKKRGPDELLEDEVVRIISKLPRMTPGEYDGQPVNVPYSIPVTFKLQ